MVECDRYEYSEKNTQCFKHQLRATQSQPQGMRVELEPPPKAIADILVEAVKTHDVALMKRLLMSRWDLDTTVDESGSSFLHIAASSSHTSTRMLRLLINHGANPYFKDDVGLTCIDRAEQFGNSDQMRKAMTEELALAALENNPQMVEVLLKAGLHVDSTVENSETALHKAASSGNMWICNILIKWGANVEAQDKNGRTPAAHAYANAQYTTGRLLLRSGAKPPTGVAATPSKNMKGLGKCKSRLQMLMTGMRMRAMGYARQHFTLKCEYHPVDHCDLKACEDMEHRMYREFITHQQSFSQA